LDLLRHGEALPAGEGGDGARALSETGRSAVARVADEYLRRGWRPDRVCSSPLRRARQSAEILIARLAAPLESEVWDGLMPDRTPEDLTADLEGRELGGHVVLVGHQPLLGQLASYLTGGPSRPLPTAGLLVLRATGRLGRQSAWLELEWRAALEA
jgi:phosphohistidine phosphatase